MQYVVTVERCKDGVSWEYGYLTRWYFAFQSSLCELSENTLDEKIELFSDEFSAKSVAEKVARWCRGVMKVEVWTAERLYENSTIFHNRPIAEQKKLHTFYGGVGN